MGIRNSTGFLAAALLAVPLLAVGGGARAAEPTLIRTGYVVAPGSLLPILFPVPGIARHFGKSYTLQITHFRGTTPVITALAAGEVDIAELGFSTVGLAIENAGLSDLRVIADEIEDGAPGYFTGEYGVLRDSPIRTIADLKGKVVATNAIGAGADIILRAVLVRHDLKPNRDFTDVEVSFGNMAAELSEHKIDLGTFIPPFIYQPAVEKMVRPLIRQKDAFGPVEMAFLTARTSFLRQHRQAVVDFLQDYIRSVRWYTDPAHHDKAVAYVAKFTRLPPAVLDSWLFTKRDYYRNANARPDLQALQKNISAQAKLGFLKSDLDVAKYADLSLVDEAAAREQRDQ